MDSKNTSKTIVKTQRLVVNSVAWGKKTLANKSSGANFQTICILTAKDSRAVNSAMDTIKRASSFLVETLTTIVQTMCSGLSKR